MRQEVNIKNLLMSLRRAVSSTIILLIALVCSTTALKAQEPETAISKRGVGTRSISFLVEEGSILPAMPLAELSRGKGRVETPLADHLIVDEPVKLPKHIGTPSVELTFSILEGNARFQSPEGIMATTSLTDGVIMTPPIVSGPAYDESFFQVMFRGRIIIGRMRVATLPAGGIQNLARYIMFADPSVVTIGEHYAVIDEEKLTNITDETITFQMPEGEESKGLGGPKAVASLCIRTPFKPGLVKWNINRPGRSGAGFSVKPEGPNSLTWASAPSNAVDAIYNRAWGCGVALKVPDSCTITWNSSGWSSCCNATMAAFGYVPRWVNPGQHNFPYCPLL